MPPLAEKVLQIAASRIGYYAPNDPLPGSEAGRWMADLWESFPNAAAAHAAGCANWQPNAGWLRGPSTTTWWCCMWVSMIAWLAGCRNLPGIPNYNCDSLKEMVRAAKSPYMYILPSKYDATPGDFVLFDWARNGRRDGLCDHIGIVEINLGNVGEQSIEGNTSGSNGGSQSSGNGVWRRTRSWADVNCVIHIAYELLEDDMPSLEEIWGYDGAGGKLTAASEGVNAIKDDLATVIRMLAPQAPVSPFGGTVYRLRNVSTGVHTWTNSTARRDNLVAQGWTLEGDAFSLGRAGDPVWCLVRPGDDESILTTNIDEARALANAQWRNEGVIGTVGDGPYVHRLYNDGNGLHLFTTDENEVSALASSGWIEEQGGFKSA